MDDLPVPVSAAASPASLAASTCKLVAVAKPILRTTQSTDVQASLVSETVLMYQRIN